MNIHATSPHYLMNQFLLLVPMDFLVSWQDQEISASQVWKLFSLGDEISLFYLLKLRLGSRKLSEFRIRVR